MNMEDDVKSATATAGASIPASLIRALSFGNGGAGDRALENILALPYYRGLPKHLLSESFPPIRDVTDDMHDWSRLRPHRVFHGLLGLVMMSW